MEQGLIFAWSRKQKFRDFLPLQLAGKSLATQDIINHIVDCTTKSNNWLEKEIYVVQTWPKSFVFPGSSLFIVLNKLPNPAGQLRV